MRLHRSLPLFDLELLMTVAVVEVAAPLLILPT
jgi:hypothetical protein